MTKHEEIMAALAEIKKMIHDRDYTGDHLDNEFPGWRDIVGGAAAGKKIDPEHPFRKWLGTKDQAYQRLINHTNLAPEIADAIRLFQDETRILQ